MKAIIVGGGIGGLMTGTTLLERGIDIEIYERAESIAEVGAGIWMAPNALTILDRYRLAESVVAAGKALNKAVIKDSNSRSIAETDFKGFVSRYGFTTVAIHRGRLQNILLEQIPKEKLFTGKNCVGVTTDDKTVQLTFSDGSKTDGDFLIAADGIHSNTRRQLYPHSSLRYSHQACCRFVVEFELPEAGKDEMIEIWANEKGLRCGYSYIDEHRVYVYITVYKDDFTLHAPFYDKSSLLKLSQNFPPIVKAMVEAAAEESFIYDYLTDLPLQEPWVRGRIALLGDAAHASTPNLGQGGCQAVEDAYALSICLQTGHPIEESLKRYEKLRRKKADFVREASWQLSQLTNLGGWKKSIVKTILHHLPDSIQERQINKLYSIDYLKAEQLNRN